MRIARKRLPGFTILLILLNVFLLFMIAVNFSGSIFIIGFH